MGVVVAVVVHPSNEAPGMWRWAVHLGTVWTDRDSCLNAGAGDSRLEAVATGAAVAAAVTRFADRTGVATFSAGVIELATDPVAVLCPVEVV